MKNLIQVAAALIVIFIPIQLLGCNAASVMNMAKYAGETPAYESALALAETVAIDEDWTNQASTLAAAGTILAEWQWQPGRGLNDRSAMLSGLGYGWYSRNHPGAGPTVRDHAVFHGSEWRDGVDFRGQSIRGWWFEEVELPEIVASNAG